MTTLNKNKGKGKDDHTTLGGHHYSKTTNQEYRPYKLNTIKKKNRCNDNEPQASSKNLNYEDGNFSSFFYPPKHNETTRFQTKRYGNLNQIYPSVSPTRQLKSLDYLNSRRNSLSITPVYHRNSVDEKFNMDIPPNTLPPISTTFLSDGKIQDGIGLHASFKPPKLTSAPLMSYDSTSHNNSYPSLPTLDSFEASIMKTLPFENKYESTR